MLVSCVHPVAILRAVFCTICSLSMFVSDALGDHMVEAYSSTGLVMALYVAIWSFFFFYFNISIYAHHEVTNN